jgi:hypothetical protein
MRHISRGGLRAVSVLLTASFLFSCPLSSRAEEPQGENVVKVGGSVAVALNSKYIWRGQNLVDGPVFQPEGSLSYRGWTGTVWANHDLDEEDEWTEADYTLDYTTSLGGVSKALEWLSVSAGYTYYTFPPLAHHPEIPPERDDSHEVYGGVSFDTLLSPSLTVYWDFGQGDGVYYELGIGHGIPLGAAELSLGGTVGYNDGQWGYDSSFSAAVVSAAVSVPVTQGLTWGASAAASLALDSQYENEVFFGTGMAFSF